MIGTRHRRLSFPRHRNGLLALVAVVLGVALCADPAHAAEPHRAAQLQALAAGGQAQADDVTLPALGARAARPRGWLIVIHGGGWIATGAAVTRAVLGDVAPLRRAGWAVDDVDYRPGTRSLPDVLAAYAQLRARVGAATPICTWGQSAGAHLALLLAAREPLIRCVVSEAAPTDLATLPTQAGWAPPGVSPLTGPEWTFQNLIVPTFGSARSGLLAWSPVAYAGLIRARVLLGGSSADAVVPEAGQLAEMQRALGSARATSLLLPGAPTPAGAAPDFPHASITPAGLARWRAAELALLAGVEA